MEIQRRHQIGISLRVNILNLKGQKNLSKFVYVLAKQGRSPFNLTNFLTVFENQQKSYLLYRLVGVCFAIHLIHVGMILYYIMKKYKPRQKNVEVGIDVDDKANGTAMIF